MYPVPDRIDTSPKALDMTLKETAFKFLMTFGLYPHIRFTYSPFKIIEFNALMNRVDFSGDEIALDIGCGDGLHTLLIGEKVGHVVGIDVNPDFIRRAQSYGKKFAAKASTEFIAAPLETIGFPDDKFDIIFSICVIEHIENYEEVLQECRRILKPGGRILFTVDTLEQIPDENLVAKHTGQHHVYQYFRQDTLGALLTRIGFRDIQFAQLFRSPLAQELFIHGINHGFNFGRFKASSLAVDLQRAEDRTAPDAPGIFLLADAACP